MRTGACETCEDAGVSVVLATRGRPELLRAAVSSILAQSTSEPVDVIVVFDQMKIDSLADLEVPSNRKLILVENNRTKGLAGARNTGIMAAVRRYVAFCDDDDEWFRDKLSSQLHEWDDEPEAAAVVTGVRIETGSRSKVRVGPRRAGFPDFLESRLTEMHPSTFLFRRAQLIDQFGLLDEVLPYSYGEDYDLLLRVSRHGYVLNVPRPLVTINWNRASYFVGRWRGVSEGLMYLLCKYPELKDSKKGYARIAGQIAFALAALGDFRAARSWARATIAADRRQIRAYAAYAVGLRLVSPHLAVDLTNRLGRGV